AVDGGVPGGAKLLRPGPVAQLVERLHRSADMPRGLRHDPASGERGDEGALARRVDRIAARLLVRDGPETEQRIAFRQRLAAKGHVGSALARRGALAGRRRWRVGLIGHEATSESGAL